MISFISGLLLILCASLVSRVRAGGPPLPVGAVEGEEGTLAYSSLSVTADRLNLAGRATAGGINN